MRPVDTVIDFLKAEQARGKTHIWLDGEARDGLRELYIKARGQKTTPQADVQPEAPTKVTPAPEIKLSATPPPTAETPAAPPTLKIEGTSKAEKLNSLYKQAKSWPPIHDLGTLRQTMVFATGNPEAKIMLVGEAPGHEEERRKEPFVGPAGEKLNGILKAMGISRDDVYISNIVKYRPSTPRQTTNNRKPSPEELEACMPFIHAEISIVQPSVIIALGGTAAEGLLGLSGPVASMRGSWHEFNGIPARASYHPSYLLRSQSDNTTKRDVWEDMLAVMEKIGLPISEKQRSYFLPKG